MFLATRWALIPAVLAGWLCLAVPAQAVTPEVKDQAGVFSAEAVKKANAQIADIQRRFKRDLVIETYKEIPPDKENQSKSLGRDRFFAKWTEDRFAALRTDGIFVLICDNPKHLEVTVGQNTLQRDFRKSDADKLRREFVAGLKTGNRDEALLDSIRLVNDTIQAHRGTRSVSTAPRSAPTAPPANGEHGGGMNWGGLICMGLLILGGVWLVVGLVRAFTGGWGGGGPGYGGGWGGGGGGFFTSLLGGMFGAAAGMWMYNNFFGGHSSSFGSTAYGSEGNDAASASDEGRAGYSTGDSWDNDGGGSGGGDWGSSDTGGGDWGGGGGGGDWGGGGGDFGGGGGGDW